MTREAAHQDHSGSRMREATRRYRTSSVATFLGVLLMTVAGGCNSPSASPASTSPAVASPASAPAQGDTPAVQSTPDAFQAQKEAIDSLALEQSAEFVSSKLGVPRESHPLCSKVSTCSQGTPGEPLLNIYRDDYYTVRAIFDANSLKFFAVTMESDQYKPHIRWLYDLGALGEFTYKDASVADGIEPTAAMIHLGPRSSSYAEIISVGAPGHYQGLILGWAPDGFANLPWDIKGAEALNAKQIPSSDRKTLLKAADPFRAGSVPNTAGLFLDDGGPVSKLLQDPGNAITILYAGTNE
ncbi:ETEC_3214 domain-containing protein [Arthrobacter sp. Soil763]|uniref:ETEC_3214 domain-containing protein n=1 Tax=Arthrobacter sp. Soil763 TaxID=1736402 RepID=UPI0012F78D4A|nr:ETEC_3214 domain-containing protein [Arthrobacter sp. Soil763]